MKKVLKYWMPLAIGLTGIFAMVAVVPQAIYRESANDPQVQISEDIADILSQGEDPSGLDQQAKLDISKSLNTFIAVYDKDAKLIASNALLNDKGPEIPEGTVKAADNGQQKTTWQPQKGLRFALVITKVSGDKPSYVVVGRSLREIELRKAELLKVTGIAWAGTLILTFLASWLLIDFKRKRRHESSESSENTETKAEHRE